MAAVFHIFAATVIYDIGRDGVGFTPVAIALAWIALAIVVAVAGWRRRPPGWPLPDQHSRCRAWAADGSAQVVEGRVTAYQPQPRFVEKGHETLSVGGHTWTYSTSSLGAGGYRGVPPARHRVGVGSLVRITSRDGRILRFEVLDG